MFVFTIFFPPKIKFGKSESVSLRFDFGLVTLNLVALVMDTITAHKHPGHFQYVSGVGHPRHGPDGRPQVPGTFPVCFRRSHCRIRKLFQTLSPSSWTRWPPTSTQDISSMFPVLVTLVMDPMAARKYPGHFQYVSGGVTATSGNYFKLCHPRHGPDGRPQAPRTIPVCFRCWSP